MYSYKYHYVHVLSKRSSLHCVISATRIKDLYCINTMKSKNINEYITTSMCFKWILQNWY
jgi:hypothetical protein